MPLLARWSEVEAALRAAPRVWVGSDFDCTLAPFTDDPHEDTLPPETRAVLASFTAPVAVISGRDIGNLRARVRLDGLTYAGNHGCEIEGPGEPRWEDPTATACRPAMAAVAAGIVERVRHLSGVSVQDKGLSLTVHYRKRPDAAGEVGEIVRAVAGAGLLVRGGVLAWDVRPPTTATKGTAVTRLLAAQPAGTLPVFLGDDLSDEDGFAAAVGGITVLVGDVRPTRAAYHLGGPADVRAFLRGVATIG